MKAADVRTLDDKALLLRRQDLLGEYTSVKFRHATGQLENTSVLRSLRRDLGRVNTIIREREHDQNLPKGGLLGAVGGLDSSQSAFAAFRRAMGAGGENG